jgi:hypothetical protein
VKPAARVNPSPFNHCLFLRSVAAQLLTSEHSSAGCEAIYIAPLRLRVLISPAQLNLPQTFLLPSFPVPTECMEASLLTSQPIDLSCCGPLFAEGLRTHEDSSDALACGAFIVEMFFE